ncbi:MAG: hypothetical protein MI810_10460 [Flavobacteriales bacterium]|nr:hypothetical protein [Flavobacteriales bacterium]
MKLLIAFFLLLAPTEDKMTEIRDLFSRAAEDEQANRDLMSMTDGYTLEYSPIMFAYHAGAVMTWANHTLSPITKCKYFYDGAADLEDAIEYEPDNVEMRFIRFCVQDGSPSYLGYNGQVDEDKAYVLKHIDRTGWSPSYKKEVKQFLED